MMKKWCKMQNVYHLWGRRCGKFTATPVAWLENAFQDRFGFCQAYLAQWFEMYFEGVSK